MSSVKSKIINDKRWCLVLAVLPLYRNHLIDLLCKSVGWFLCRGNTGLKWQSGCMVKVNVKQVGSKVVATWHRRKN